MDTLFTIVGYIIAALIAWQIISFVFKPLNKLTEKLTGKLSTCPFCKSEIPKDAIVCKYCRREIEQDKNINNISDMKPEDFIAQRELRDEAINKVMDKFSSEYPKVNFRYDTTLGDIIINVPSSLPEPKLKSEDIQLKMIEELRNWGVNAKARFLSKDTIKTRGILEGTLEEVASQSIQDVHAKTASTATLNFRAKIKGPEDSQKLYFTAKEFANDNGLSFERAKKLLTSGTILNFKTFESKDKALKIIDKYKSMGCEVELAEH